jgi:stage V sporulation protein B
MAKGTIYLIIANVVFSIAGYIIHFGLGRYLGPVEYGTFGVVLNLMTIVNLFMTSGIPLSASKYIAEDNAKTGYVIREANRVQMAFGALIFVLYLSLAGVIASLLRDSSLTPYIRISALAIPAYALYSIYNAGYLNGLRKFGRQAIAISGVSLAKVAATFILVFVGFGIYGAIAGYVFGALVGFLIAWRFIGAVSKSETSFGWRRLITFGVPTTAFAVVFYLLLSIGLLMVKAMESGGVEVGYYTAANNVANISYFLFIGLATSLFPSISKATASNHTELTRSYIRQSIRYMLMLLVPIALLINATSADLLTLVYSRQYIEAANPLSVLVFGIGLLSTFYILANIIMGSGKPWIVLGIALPLVGINMGLNIYLIPKYALTGAAWATTITGLLGMSAAAIYVFWRFKALISAKSLGRICLASVVIYVIALQLSLPPRWLPLIYIGLFALYAGILWLTRELNKGDLKTLRKIVPLERFIGGSEIP